MILRTLPLTLAVFGFCFAPARANDFDACVKQKGEAAIHACSAAISSGQHKGDRLAELYNSRGAEWRLRFDFARAIADYDEALLLAPHYVAALNNRCWALAAIGRVKEALDDCNVSLRVRPGFDIAHHNRGFAHFRAGNFGEALADLELTLKANPKRPQALYLRGLIKLGSGDAKGGDADIAAAKRLRASVQEEFERMGVTR
ncbi:MAG TPA: tetratricopeptide repeat protein [Xanthobacteraceae bacterium]|nr:tetratricopeptide repeat protein [Xanthobacteraceae bacterium]